METERNKHYYNCYVSGCLNSTLNSDKSFFRIPVVTDKRNQWLKLMQREDLIGIPCLRARVCEAHFHPHRIKAFPKRKILVKGSIPELLLPLPDNTCKRTRKDVKVKIQKADASVQCDYEFQINPHVLTPLHISKGAPRNRTILREILTSNKRSKLSGNLEKSDFHKLCDKYLSKTLALIIKQQIKDNAQSSGHKFNFDYKIFCLNLFYVSPQAYDLLKDILCFPSKETLMKMYMPVTTEINNHLIGVLKAKTQNKSNMNRNCTLVIGTIKLKANLYYNIREDRIYGFHEVNGVQSPEPARYASVAMIHGLFENYKQLVGFALLAECKNYESVSDWIDKLILELSSIGLQVRVLVSDLSSDFLTSRNISAESPFFFVGERKIYCILDAPHLFTSARNNLMNYEFHFKTSVAKWQHITQFYDTDKLKRLRLASKLTDKHIKPINVEKTKVKYAVQVLSATVAAGLSTYRDFGAIENSAEGTIKFIELMNDLFDFLNTSFRLGGTQYQNAFCGDEYQTYFVNKMLKFFASLKLINPNNGKNVTFKVKFIEGFRITLKSLLLLFDDLKIDGFSYILTRRLNQDCLENFFDHIRTKNGSSEPTAWQLVSAFKKVCFINILKSPKSVNCADDLAKCLLDVEKLYVASIEQDPLADTDTTLTMAFNRKNKNGGSAKTNSIPSISTSDYNSLDLPETNALVYVSGFLLRKCLNHHNECKAFMTYTLGEDKSQNGSQDSTFTHYEDYCKDGTKNLVDIPPDSFVEFVRSMEERFCNFFKRNSYLNCEVLKSILNEVETLTFTMPCQCFPLEYCRRLYIRVRIYHTLKNNNRAFHLSRNRQQLFLTTNL